MPERRAEPERRVRHAMDALEVFSTRLKLLGVYPKAPFLSL